MKKRGFTLIELMVVIAIIGLLAAIALPRFANVSDSAKVANVQGNISSLRTAISMHFAKNDAYPALPTTGSDLDTITTSTNGANVAFTEFYGKSNLPETPGSTTNSVTITKKKTLINTASGNDFTTLDANGDGGWMYRAADGAIRANLKTGAYGDNTITWSEF